MELPNISAPEEPAELKKLRDEYSAHLQGAEKEYKKQCGVVEQWFRDELNKVLPDNTYFIADTLRVPYEFEFNAHLGCGKWCIQFGKYHGYRFTIPQALKLAALLTEFQKDGIQKVL